MADVSLPVPANFCFPCIRLLIMSESRVFHAGFLEVLLMSHKWPDGIPVNVEWLGPVLELVCDLFAQHCQDTLQLGIEPKEHLRAKLAVPG